MGTEGGLVQFDVEGTNGEFKTDSPEKIGRRFVVCAGWKVGGDWTGVASDIAGEVLPGGDGGNLCKTTGDPERDLDEDEDEDEECDESGDEGGEGVGVARPEILGEEKGEGESERDNEFSEEENSQ